MGSDGAVTIEITGDSSDLLKELAGLKSKISDAQQQEDNLGKSATGFGSIAKAACKTAVTAFAAVGTAVAGAATYAITAGMDFEAAMSNVAAISGASGNQLELLSDKAKEMGAATKFSATESAEALSYMAMAGWKTEDMLNGLNGIVNLAAASGEDLAATSDIVTDALTAFGLSAKDSGQFADVLAAASSNANTNVSTMGETFKYAAPVAGALGYSVQDTAVAIGLMANAGIKGGEAGTTLRAIMANLSSPTEQVAGYMDKLGMSITDANGDMRPLRDLLIQLREKFDTLSESQRAEYAAGLAGKEGMSGLLAIISASDGDFDKLTSAIDNSSGAAEQMASTMNDNLKGRITELGSAAEGVAIQVYEAMEGSLKEGVEGAIDSVGELSDEMSDGKLKDSAEKIAQGFGKIVKGGAELTSKVLPELIDGFAWLVDNGKSVASGLAATAAGYAAFKSSSRAVDTLSKAMAVLTEHEAAHRLTLVAANGGLSASSMLVGALTGKITLATAAQAAWNAVTSINPYVALATGVAALTVGLGLYLSAQESEIEKAQEAAAAAEEERQAFENLLGARQNSINGSMAEIDNAELLIARFRSLTDETGRVKEGTDKYAEAKGLAAQINAVAPGAIEDLENENGKYLKICDSVDLLIAKKRLESMIDANADAYNEALQNKAQAEQDYAQAKADATNARIAYEQAEEEAAQHSTGSLADEYNIKAADARDYMESLEQTASDKGTVLSGYYQVIADQDAMLAASQSDNIDTVKDAMLDYESTIVEFTGKNAAACLQQMQNNDAVLRNKKSNLAEGMAVSQEEISAAQSAADQQTQIAAQGISDMIQAVRSKTSDAADAQKSINDAMVDAVSQLEEPLSSEAAQAVAASIIQMQIEANGAETVGQNFADGYYKGLFDNLGIADEVAAQLVQSAIDKANTTQESHSPSQVMYRSGTNFAQGYANGITDNADIASSPAAALAQAAIFAVQNGLSNLPVIGGMFASLFGGGITSGAETANTAASNMSAGATNAARNGLVGLPGIGALAPSLFGNGITGNKGAASNAMSNVAAAAASAAGAQRGLFGASGSSDATAFTSGIQSGKGAADTASKTVAQSSAKTMDAQKSQYSKAGSTVAGQFKSGIGSTQNAIKSTSKTIAAAGHIAAAATRTSWGTVGNNLAAGLASGIAGGKSSVINAAANLARRAIEAAKNALGIHSPSKVADKEIGQQYSCGVAEGVEKRSENVRKAVVGLMDTKKLTLDTVINADASGIGDMLISSVNARIAHASTAMFNHSSSPASTGGKTVTIYYQPEQKCDEPITARRLNEINRQNARRMERIIKNA